MTKQKSLLFWTLSNIYLSWMECVPVEKDPTSPLKYKVRILIKNNSWPGNIRNIIKEYIFAFPPQLIRKYKDHKHIPSMRPLVAKYSIPTYYIEKALVPVLKDFLPSTTYSISSAEKFLEDLFEQDIQLQDSLASLDIVNLFSSVNIDYVFQLNSERLAAIPYDYSDSEKTTIKDALKLVITSILVFYI